MPGSRDQFKESDCDNYLVFGWAALNQRKTDDALRLFEGLCLNPVRRNSSTFTFLGLALLASGKVPEAESNLTEAINRATNRRDIQLFLDIALFWAEREAAAWPHGAQALRLIARFKSLAESKRVFLEQNPRVPEQELQGSYRCVCGNITG